MKDVLTIVLPVLLGGGFLTGIYMLLKLRPEAGQITVSAAQGALVVQSRVIDDLREELDRLKARVADLQQKLDHAEAEALRLRTENTEMRRRLDALEQNNEGGTT